jgi:hypothetical protein
LQFGASSCVFRGLAIFSPTRGSKYPANCSGLIVSEVNFEFKHVIRCKLCKLKEEK